MNASPSNENLTALVWKLAIGSTLSWELAKILGSHHPYLAPLSAILCLQSTINQTLALSAKRLIGTVIGIMLTILIAANLRVTGWNLGLLILIGGFITKYLKSDKITIHQVALTILFVFVFEQQTKHYAMDRMRDTVIGLAAGVIIQILWFRFILPLKKRAI
ncbi:FUSC family protein [Niallia nealsonii]|uniref:Integral membrane bound transporter domain-containing protein n=1 Tax=Niallia nealsonii TaxID=115979 RepID=A0A2N0Z0T8_9BACI|nr:FUSC family protein [Niallia nealsonii]PKG23132.1 hypothetical protein CWS01_13765 [Niallia nealsonii]